MGGVLYPCCEHCVHTRPVEHLLPCKICAQSPRDRTVPGDGGGTVPPKKRKGK